VYNVAPACGRSGVEDDSCEAKRVGKETVCGCPVSFEAVDARYVSGVDGFGYHSYGMTVMTSTVGLLAAEQTAPSVVWTDKSTSAFASSTGRVGIEPATVGLSVGLGGPLLVLILVYVYTRMKSQKYKEEVEDAWKAVNADRTLALASDLKIELNCAEEMTDVLHKSNPSFRDETDARSSYNSSEPSYDKIKASPMVLKTEGLVLGRGHDSNTILADLEVGHFYNPSEGSENIGLDLSDDDTMSVDDGFSIPTYDGILDLKAFTERTI